MGACADKTDTVLDRQCSISVPDVRSGGFTTIRVPSNNLQHLKVTIKDSGIFESSDVTMQSVDEPDKDMALTSHMSHADVMNVFSKYTDNDEKITMVTYFINICQIQK